jgi:hypothetical protein
MNWDAPRKCRFCKTTFRPKRPQDSEQRFCCPEHRAAFNAGSRLKITAVLRAEFQETLLALEKRIAALEKVLDLGNSTDVTLRSGKTQ